MKQADAAESNDEANKLNGEAVDLRVANSKLDARLQQLDFQSHSLMQDVKKVGPNLKDVRLKLNKNWIPVWLKKPTDFRPTTKMPNFRLTDHQIQAISAYIWQSGFTDELPKQKPGNAAHGKELFETRGCLACHSIGEGDQMQGGTFAANLTRVGEKANYDYLVRWIHNAAPAHAALLPVREERHRSRGLRQEGPSLPVRSRPQQVSERRPRTASAEHDGDAEPAPEPGGRGRHRNVSHDAEEAGAVVVCGRLVHGRSGAERRRQEVGSPVRLRGCHEIAGLEDEGRIGTELTYEGSKPIERLDFALFTEARSAAAKTRSPSPTRKIWRDCPRAPRKPWYDHKGFFEHKLAEPNVYDQGKVKGEMEALRMPNLHLTKEQVLDLTTFLMGSQETSLPAELSVQTRRCAPRHSGRLVDRKEIQLHGMPPVHPRPANDPDGIEAISGCAGAIAAEVADGRRARRSGMAAQIPFEPGAEHDRHKPQRRAAVSEGAHADVLVLRQRAAKAGAILPGAVAAAMPYIPEEVPTLTAKETDMARSLFSSTAAPCSEVPRYRRSESRQDRDCAEFPAGERAPEAGLGGALDHRSASGEPRNVHAVGPVQEAE